jgi:hypothetical protein
MVGLRCVRRLDCRKCAMLGCDQAGRERPNAKRAEPREARPQFVNCNPLGTELLTGQATFRSASSRSSCVVPLNASRLYCGHTFSAAFNASIARFQFRP